MGNNKDTYTAVYDTMFTSTYGRFLRLRIKFILWINSKTANLIGCHEIYPEVKKSAIRGLLKPETYGNNKVTFEFVKECRIGNTYKSIEMDILLETAKRCQQDYYELLSDWNIYKDDEHEYLKNFIGYALSGPPQLKDDGSYNYEPAQLNVINMLYTKIIEANKNNGSQYVYCGLVYNIIYMETKSIEKESATETNNANEQREDRAESESNRNKELEKHVYPVPVFKIQQHSHDKERRILHCGYIDTEGRLYKKWSDYITTNTLPSCTMVFPKDGYYQADPNLPSAEMYSSVWLDISTSPACSTANKVLFAIDMFSTVAGVGSMIIGAASLAAVPIIAPVAIASVIGGGVSGAWTAGRCSYQLIDRSTHNQSINVTNQQALSAWFGIAGSSFGLASSGGTAFLTKAIQSGTNIGTAARAMYNSITIGNIVVNSFGLGFNSYTIYTDYMERGEISLQDLFRLTAHLVFFGCSIINVKLAGELIESTQGNVLKEYEASLRSNRHRREFRRMVRNTEVGRDEVFRNKEIIRSINKIENKDDFFAGLVRSRKIFNAAKAKVSFADGRAKINNAILIDPMEFSQLSAETKISIANISQLKQLQILQEPVFSVSSRIPNVWYSDSVSMLQTQLARGISLSYTKLVHYAHNILQDIGNMDNKEVILTKLYNIVLRIMQRVDLERNEYGGRTPEMLCGEVLTYVWGWVKEKVKRVITMSISNIMENELIIKIINELEKYVQVETKADEIFQSFLQQVLQFIFPNKNIVQ